MDVCVIPYSDCLALRHKVLWPNVPIERSKVPHDDTALHLGIIRDSQLVSCLSVFEQGEWVQVRKFATLPQFQGQGYGSTLLRHVLAMPYKCIFLDARTTATEFYTRFGFKPVGEPFYKVDMQHIRMELKR